MNSWGKIYTVGDQRIHELFHDPVSITEKLDGSQFNFGIHPIEGFWAKSKNQKISPDNVPNLFIPTYNYVSSIKDKLPVGYSFHGEALMAPKHNTLKYNRVPKGHIAIFGVITHQFKAMREEEFAPLVESLGLESVKVLASGVKISNYKQLEEFLDLESFLGGTQLEGIVVKNYSKCLEIFGKIFPVLQGKVVTERFKEKHKENPEFMDPIERILSSYVKENRWQKAIQHWVENGNELNVQAIGPLIGLVSKDFNDEEKENIKELLWKNFKKRIISTQVRGFPEWLKEKLRRDNQEYFNAES
jgi:hypothetical protein